MLDLKVQFASGVDKFHFAERHQSRKAGETLKESWFPALYLLAPFLLLWQMLLRKLTVLWLNERNLYFKIENRILAEVGNTRKMLLLALSGLVFSRGFVYMPEAEKERISMCGHW